MEHVTGTILGCSTRAHKRTTKVDPTQHNEADDDDDDDDDDDEKKEKKKKKDELDDGGDQQDDDNDNDDKDRRPIQGTKANTHTSVYTKKKRVIGAAHNHEVILFIHSCWFGCVWDKVRQQHKWLHNSAATVSVSGREQ